MTDYLTTCLSTEEATVIAILTKAPFNQSYVRTYGDFTGGNLSLNTFDPGSQPGEVACVARAGDKVVIHTQSP